MRDTPIDLTVTLGWIATVLFTVCYVPQIIKTVRTRTVEGMSFLLLFLQFIGNIVALWYATRIAQPPLQVKYILALLFLVICIALYLRIVLRRDR